MSGRIPCINPQCRRTAPADKYDPGTEIICGKCFRSLPAATRAAHRGYWRELRKWDRRITRAGDELKIARMHGIRDRFSRMIKRQWDREIKPHFLSPAKPEGLDGFLEEAGLA